MKVLAVYEDPKSYLERYLFILPYISQPYTIPPMRVYIGISADGRKYTVGEALYFKDGRKNRHLGRRIKMSQVPKEVKESFEEILKKIMEEEENERH